MADFEMSSDLVMNQDCRPPSVPLSMLSDAGAWLVRLSGPLRSAATEEGFQKWLRENPLHRVAFQRVSAEWDEADKLKRYTDVVIRVPGGAGAARARNQPIIKRGLLAAAAASVLAAVAALFFILRSPGIETGINELRVVTLSDGSKVHLNTSTRIVVAYAETQRLIRLDFGEALFEVAKYPEWPLIVTVADRQVRAVGTSFLIRRDADRIAVTLMDGQVAISPTFNKALPPAASTVVRDHENGILMLEPGERLTFSADTGVARRDRPEVNKLLSWQQGKVAIDDLPLARAVAEMNRYSAVRLVLEQPQPEGLLLSGVFAAGQSMSFARAVAQSYGLRIVDHGDTIVLAGIGRSAVDRQNKSSSELRSPNSN